MVCLYTVLSYTTLRDTTPAIRNNSRIIITNVDMLHLSILQQHRQWQRFLSNLTVVVVDEAHYYRGLFGSHVAMLMRRRQRILTSYTHLLQGRPAVCAVFSDHRESR